MIHTGLPHAWNEYGKIHTGLLFLDYTFKSNEDYKKQIQSPEETWNYFRNCDFKNC